MKKPFIILFSIFFVLFTFCIYELTNIDKKYVNKPTITFDINNIRNPQVKNLIRKIDLVMGDIYFRFNIKKQKEFINQDLAKYNNLPEEIFVPANLDNLTLSNNKNFNNFKDWKRSHGNHSSNKFSDLDKINTRNIKNLDLAWSYQFKKKGVIPGNAIFYNGIIYLSSTEKSLVALNAKDGSLIWEHKTEGKAAPRGLLINEEKIPKVFFCDQYNLISLNALDGKPIKKFGKNGKIKLNNKCHVTPVILDDKIIIATFEPSIEVYDLIDGKIDWKFYLKEKNNDFFRYGGKRFDYSGGNPWGGISADIDRKILYVSTGNAGRFYDGTNRPGKNKYSNSIVALDIIEKKLLWEFQEIEHDIWNMDIASPPILTSIKVKDKLVDVIVVPTKYGNTLVLDRLSGQNIFDYTNKKVPLSSVPGEKTAYYQKVFDLPEPFSRRFFKMKDITNFDTENINYVKDQIEGATHGFFVPNSVNKKNIIYKGGAQWMGASVDNSKGIMYVNSNDLASLIWLEKIQKKNSYYDYNMKTKILKDKSGYPGSKPPWGNLTAIDLNNGKIIWRVPFGEYEELSKKGIPITGTINYGGVTGTRGDLVFATGTIDNKIRAFDSKDGKELWNYKLAYAGSNPPTIYSHDNEQFVLVVSTGSKSMKQFFPKQTEVGDMVYVFKLKN